MAAVEEEDLTEYSGLVSQGCAAPESRGAFPAEDGAPWEGRDDHVAVDRTAARGCQTALPVGLEARLTPRAPATGRGGMPQQPGQPAAKTRRISGRELRPPQPLAPDLHDALEPYVPRVPWAPPSKKFEQRQGAHQSRGLLPGGIQAAHVQDDLGGAAPLQLFAQRGPTPQATRRRILDDKGDVELPHIKDKGEIDNFAAAIAELPKCKVAILNEMLKANGVTSQGRTKIDRIHALMMHNVVLAEDVDE